MNNEYIYTKDYIIVETDNGLEKRKNTSNISKILEVENNIEEIQKLKSRNNNDEILNYKNILDYNTKQFFKKFFGITLPLILFIAIITSIVSNINIALLILPMLLCGDGILVLLCTPFNIHKSHKDINNISKCTDKLLSEQLQKQKEKLKKLSNESKEVSQNNLDISNETKKINRTELIDNLKRKLELIKDYQLNKKKYIEYSKDHFISIKLKDKGYSESDINFIQTLIKEDLKLEKENKKQKTLNLKRK